MKATFFCFVLGLLTTFGIASSFVEGFGVKQYDEFHEVLHVLQHEALPHNDFATIRARTPELIKRGDAIVKLGVPPGVKPNLKEAFEKELKAFDRSLEKLATDAKSGSDSQLKTSYSAVHDSFEELAEMLPR